MKLIYKHLINWRGLSTLSLPPNTLIIEIAADSNGHLAVWVEQEENCPLAYSQRQFMAVWTGEQVPPPPFMHYRTILKGSIVTHIYY